MCTDSTLKIKNPVISTPTKYYGRHDYSENTEFKKYTIAIDWFSANLRGFWLPVSDEGKIDDIIYLDNANIRLERPSVGGIRNGNRFYKYGYEIFIQDEKFGIIFTHPCSPILKADSSELKIENHSLYQENWLDKFDYLCSELDVVVNNLTRIDIAVDGYHFLDDYDYVLSKQLQVLGKAKGDTKWKAGRIGEEHEGFNIGSPKSERMLTGYNKTDELKETNKPYIKAFHKANGMDVSKPIHRLELKIKTDAIKRIDDFDMYLLDNPSYLAGIMKSQLKGFYQFRVPNPNQKNKSRWDKLEAIDWNYFDAMEVKKLKTTKEPSVIWAVKHKIRFDMLEYLSKCGENSHNLFSDSPNHNTFHDSREKAKEYGIYDWFEMQIDKWNDNKKHQLAMIEERRKAKARAISKKPFYSTKLAV